MIAAKVALIAWSIALLLLDPVGEEVSFLSETTFREGLSDARGVAGKTGAWGIIALGRGTPPVGKILGVELK